MREGRMIFVQAAISAAAVLLLTGCATQPPPSGEDLPGFFSGFWNGLTIVFSFIGSLFWDVRIYAFPNNGGWYDFGYVLGVSAALGGGGTVAHRTAK